MSLLHVNVLIKMQYRRLKFILFRKEKRGQKIEFKILSITQTPRVCYPILSKT